MPRRAREKLNTSFFHVIVQGVNKEYIFEKEIYKQKFFNLLKESSIVIICDAVLNWIEFIAEELGLSFAITCTSK